MPITVSTACRDGSHTSHLVVAQYYRTSIDFTATARGTGARHNEVRFQASVLFLGVLSLALTHCLGSADDSGASCERSDNAQNHDFLIVARGRSSHRNATMAKTWVGGAEWHRRRDTASAVHLSGEAARKTPFKTRHGTSLNDSELTCFRRHRQFLPQSGVTPRRR